MITVTAHNQPSAPHHRSIVALVDPNVTHRDQMAQALLSFYRVADYPSLKTAIGMTSQAPSVVVVDEAVRDDETPEIVRTLRKEVLFRDVPIIVCRAKDRPLEWKQSADSAPDAVLEKPFRRSDLVNAISNLLNHKVEAAWADLPPKPQESLRNTLRTFNGIADLVEKGEPLTYEELDQSCAPLIQAVEGSEHKHILAAVRGHDNYSYVHSMRVATLLTLFGTTIGLKDQALVILAVGGLVHDIGKMSIPHEVLNKAGKLSEAEMAQIRGHVDRTAAYLHKHSNVPKGVLTIAAQHHEKLDGSGYPKGLKGKDLNDLARMSAIVDVFAALTDRRPYRKLNTPEHALAVMTEEMPGQLDTRLLKLFRSLLLDTMHAA